MEVCFFFINTKLAKIPQGGVKLHFCGGFQIFKSLMRPLSTFILAPHINNPNIFRCLVYKMYISTPHGQNNGKNMYNWHYVVAIEMGYTPYIVFIFHMAYWKASIIH